MKYWQLFGLLSAIYGSQTNAPWVNVVFCLLCVGFAVYAAARDV